MVKFTPQSAYLHRQFDRHNVNMSTVFSLIFRTVPPLVRGILERFCIKISWFCIYSHNLQFLYFRFTLEGGVNSFDKEYILEPKCKFWRNCGVIY